MFEVSTSKKVIFKANTLEEACKYALDEIKVLAKKLCGEWEFFYDEIGNTFLCVTRKGIIISDRYYVKKVYPE